jgi:hypothetical protein
MHFYIYEMNWRILILINREGLKVVTTKRIFRFRDYLFRGWGVRKEGGPSVHNDADRGNPRSDTAVLKKENKNS